MAFVFTHVPVVLLYILFAVWGCLVPPHAPFPAVDNVPILSSHNIRKPAEFAIHAPPILSISGKFKREFQAG
jgi:hypothetical protein